MRTRWSNDHCATLSTIFIGTDSFIMILFFFRSLSFSDTLSVSQYSGSSIGLLKSQFESAGTMNTSSYHSSEPDDHIYLADQSDEDPTTCDNVRGERATCRCVCKQRPRTTDSPLSDSKGSKLYGRTCPGSTTQDPRRSQVTSMLFANLSDD